MALINCPECNKEISDKAENCIHCGFPLNNIKNINEVAPATTNDLVKDLVMGNYSYFVLNKVDFSTYQLNDESKRLIQGESNGIKIDVGEKIDLYDANNEIIETVTITKIKHADKPNVIIEFTSKNTKLDKAKYGVKSKHEYIFQQYISQEERYMNYQRNLLNQPTIKCPTCGSTDTQRISSMEKVTNVALFGLFGNKRKMQFHCNNCKYDW